MESVCWGNSTVGSNPTLSAISKYPYTLTKGLFSFHATFSGRLAGPCTVLQGGSKRCPSLSISGTKTNHGWRYEALGIGRRPEAAKNGPFYIRVREKGKYRWEKHLSELEAKRAAESAPVERKAQALELVPDDLTNEANSNRTPIKIAVEAYVHERRFGRPCSIAIYENVFEQLLQNLPKGVRYIDQLANARTLNTYVEFSPRPGLQQQDNRDAHGIRFLAAQGEWCRTVVEVNPSCPKSSVREQRHTTQTNWPSYLPL